MVTSREHPAHFMLRAAIAHCAELTRGHLLVKHKMRPVTDYYQRPAIKKESSAVLQVCIDRSSVCDRVLFMTSLQYALSEVRRTEDSTVSFEMRLRMVEGGYISESSGWLSLTPAGVAELAKADAAKAKRSAASKARSAGLRSQGLRKTADGWA